MNGKQRINRPLVSVIMNCYNGARYLKEAIDSVYAQTYGNWEIIFWDNVSIDDSPNIVKNYGKKIRYFRGDKNIPLGAARNEAVQRANGEYIAFLDCDDVWFPYTLERMVQGIESGNFGVCYGGVVNIDSEGREFLKYIPSYSSGNIFENLLMQFDINVPSVIVKKLALQETDLSFDSNITASEEYCLFMQLAVKYDFCVLNETIAKYRVHDRALTNLSISKWASEREYTLNLILEKDGSLNKKYCEGFKEAYARARYYRARYFMHLGERKLAINEMKKNVFLGYKYFVLFILLFLPKNIWDGLHKLKTGRMLIVNEQ